MILSRPELAKIRYSRGHSYHDAAAASGVSKATLIRVEKHGHTPTTNTLIRLIKYYGLNADQIAKLFLEEDQNARASAS